MPSPSLSLPTALPQSSAVTSGVSEANVPTHELVCQRYGAERAVYVHADVTVAENIERVVKKAVEVGRRLDV